MDDEIEFELPVYINNQTLSILQYPTRTSKSNNLKMSNSRLKLKSNEIQIDMALDKNEEFDESMDINTITFKSEVVPPKMNYFTLTVNDGIHLNPVEHIYQMRPDLNKEKLVVNDEQQRRRGASFYSNERLLEKHIELECVTGEMESLCSSSQHTVDIKSNTVLDLLSERETGTTESDLKTILHRAQILPFKIIYNLHKFLKHEELLKMLEDISYEVNGNFIMKSEYYNVNPELRNYVLLQIEQGNPIARSKIKFGQSSDEIIELLQPLCVLKEEGWVCKYPSNFDFQIQYPKEHDKYVEILDKLKLDNPYYESTIEDMLH